MLLQACIAFALHRGMAVIPKTVTPSRIVENMKATEVKLDAEDMKRLRELGSKNFRLLAATVRFQVIPLEFQIDINADCNLCKHIIMCRVVFWHPKERM